MPNCTKELFQYQSFDRRKIEASFAEGDVSSDGGVMAVSQADHLIGLTSSLNQAMKDPRDPSLITHDQKDLLKQRIYGLTRLRRFERPRHAQERSGVADSC